MQLMDQIKKRHGGPLPAFADIKQSKDKLKPALLLLSQSITPSHIHREQFNQAVQSLLHGSASIVTSMAIYPFFNLSFHSAMIVSI
jgi:hypothetical protein